MQTTTAMAELDAGGTLSSVESAVRARRAAEVSLLRSAAQWADLHGDHEGVTRGHGALDEEGYRRVHPDFRRFGGEGTPLVAEFAPAELAVSLRVHPLGARAWIADALDLRHRLSPLWALLDTDAPFEVWVLRKIAAKTRHLDPEPAVLIAEDLAPVVASLAPSRLLERLDALVLLAEDAAAEADRQDCLSDRFVTFNRSDRRGLKGLYAKLASADAVVGESQVQALADKLLARDLATGTARSDLDSVAVARSRALGMLLADPEAASRLLAGEAQSTTPTDVGRARASTVVHLHLAEGALQALARCGAYGGHPAGVGRVEGHGPISLPEALELLSLTDVTIRPVLDPWATAPVDSYAFTGALREAVLTRTPADVYPHATCTRSHGMDLDHTEPYDPHGPPGQTDVANAGPMTRNHHRVKTHGSLNVRQPVPDVYVWRTPHGRYRLVDDTGTHDLDPWIASLVFSDHPDDQERAAMLLTTGIDWVLTA